MIRSGHCRLPEALKFETDTTFQGSRIRPIMVPRGHLVEYEVHRHGSGYQVEYRFKQVTEYGTILRTASQVVPSLRELDSLGM